MNNVARFDEFFSSVSYKLPKELENRFETVSLLGKKDKKTIILARDAKNQKKYVIKIFRGSAKECVREYENLQKFNIKDVSLLKIFGGLCLIRPYIEGKSLEQKIKDDGVMDCNEAFSMIASLLDVLTRLCNDNPNFVHRDIKPANIILTPDGNISLIDYECARSFDAKKTKDTIFVGTVDTAAPEQYGYAQSDIRTDIYAIGKTLCFALTGSYDTGKLKSFGLSRHFRHIIKKCTHFDPDNRYQTVKSLKNAVTGIHRRIKIEIALGIMILFIPMAYFCVETYKAQFVDFESEVLEMAVRQELGKTDGAIKKSELNNVERIAVVGDTFLSPDSKYECRLEDYVDDMEMDSRPRGDITDISILKDMPNLKELYLCHQNIYDISALSDLNLTTLVLTDNNIKDIEPIKDMVSLENLYLGLNPIESFEPLKNLTNLYELNLDQKSENTYGRQTPSMQVLQGLPIHRLSLGLANPVDGFSFISDMEELEYIFLWSPSEKNLKYLADAKEISTICLCDYKGDDLSFLAGCEKLEDMNLHGCKSIAGIGEIKSVKTLNFSNGEPVDLNELCGMENLCDLSIDEMDATGFDALLSLTGLQNVYVDYDMAGQIEKECAGYKFSLNIIR